MIPYIKLQIKSYPKKQQKTAQQNGPQWIFVSKKSSPPNKNIPHTVYEFYYEKRYTLQHTHDDDDEHTHMCCTKMYIMPARNRFFFFFTTTTDHCKSVCLIARGQNRRYTRNYKRVDNKIIGVFKMLFWKLCTKKMLEENLLSARLIIVIILCVWYVWLDTGQ